MTTDHATTIDAAGRRRAHRRVGTAAGAAFLLLLVLGALHGGHANANPSLPAAAPVTPSTTTPGQAVPGPSYRYGPGPDRDGRGFGFGRRRGGGGGGFGGGEPAPAPSTGATTGGSQT